MNQQTGLTLVGLALSLAVLAANLYPWWTGNRDAKQLEPFGTGFLLGTLSTMCAGGLLGLLAGCAPRAANEAGDRAVAGVTGATSTSTVAHSTLGQLTPEGALIVFLATALVVLAWKKAGKKDKKRIAGGALCGVTLCTTAGVASALSWLPGLVNGAGDQLKAAFEGAGIL